MGSKRESRGPGHYATQARRGATFKCRYMYRACVCIMYILSRRADNVDDDDTPRPLPIVFPRVSILGARVVLTLIRFRASFLLDVRALRTYTLCHRTYLSTRVFSNEFKISFGFLSGARISYKCKSAMLAYLCRRGRVSIKNNAAVYAAASTGGLNRRPGVIQ